MINVLNHGFVRLDAVMADDLSVVNAARVSFGKKKTEMDETDKGLIRYLMDNGHGTPFEHNSFRFHVKCPIFVAREWFRHRIGSFNEFSMRYSEPPADEAYFPWDEDVRTQVGKPGAYTYEPVDQRTRLLAQAEIQRVTADAFAAYRRLLDLGVARELARVVLPVGAYTEFYWTLNARSLMNFLALRNAPTALREIQYYARAVEIYFEDAMPVTWCAFVDAGRRAP